MTNEAITATEIEKRLRAAEIEVVNLSEERNKLALATIDTDDPQAEAKYASVSSSLASAELNVAKLTSALAAARERDATGERKQRLQTHESRVASLATHIGLRGKAARDLADAIQAASKAWRTLVEQTHRSSAYTQFGLFPRVQSEWNLEYLKRLVASEMWRVSADPGNVNGAALPGSQFSHINHEYNPAGSQPLAATIEKQNEAMLATLKPKETAQAQTEEMSV